MRNLCRSINRVQKEQALKDFYFIRKQLNSWGDISLYHLDLRKSTKEIDKVTRGMIDWANENGIKIILPVGGKR